MNYNIKFTNDTNQTLFTIKGDNFYINGSVDLNGNTLEEKTYGNVLLNIQNILLSKVKDLYFEAICTDCISVENNICASCNDSKFVKSSIDFNINITENSKFMLTLEQFEKNIFNKNQKSIEDQIKASKKLPKEYKEIAINHLKQYSGYKPGKVFGLNLHKDLKTKIKENNLSSGFDMGIDENGYYIHTHRARSKSYKSPDLISIKDIKFINSTG